MIRHYCFTKSSAVALQCVIALLAACAVQPETNPPGSRPAAPGTPASSPRTERPPTDADVMYRVFAGEVLGAEGDLEKAANEYLAAAVESDDPEIAERATRVAVTAQAWQHAAMAADRWALLQPDSLDAREIAARAMILVGDYTGAEHQLGAILDLLSHDQRRAWSIVTALLVASGNPNKADRVLQRLVEDHGASGNAETLLAQSRLAARSGDLEQAAELADGAIELDSGRADILAWAGRLAINMGDPERALKMYRQAWALQPQNAQIAIAYAELLRRAGDVEAAQEALAALPDAPDVRFSRVAFALESGMTEHAEAIYAGFEDAAYPDPLEKAFQAAQSAELLGKTDAAVAWYEQVATGERALVAALRRAFLLAERGDLQDARNLLSGIRIRRDPVVMQESFIAEGQILLEAGQPEAAFTLLTEALDILAGDTQILYSRALIAVQLGELGAAEQDLRQILDEEPQNAAALNALGYTLADLTDRYSEAETLINAAYALQPGEASIIDSMGWIAFRQGRLEDAERYLRDAWSRDNNAEIAAHLGEVLWAMGREEEAEAAWRDGLRADDANRVLLDTMTRFGLEP